MKIGVDFHGVITDNPEFFTKWIDFMMINHHEVHIMTGARKHTFEEECKELNIIVHYNEFFSISEFHAKHHPDKIDMTDPDRPYIADKEFWDKTKAEYAKYLQLDLVIDDNPEYFKYFTTPYMLYSKGK